MQLLNEVKVDSIATITGVTIILAFVCYFTRDEINQISGSVAKTSE